MSRPHRRVHKTPLLEQLPPGVQQRFSTLSGTFAVTDAIEEWDSAPSDTWRLKNDKIWNYRLKDHNFDKWIIAMQKVLEKLGLWTFVKYPWLTRLQLGDDWEKEMEIMDTWATNILLMHIMPATLARYDLPRPLTAPQLIERLAKGPEPFRLLDLPRELRDRIYELVLVEAPRHEEGEKPIIKSVAKTKRDGQRFASRRKALIALATEDREDPCLKEDHALMLTSRQVRRECDPIYWSQNAWRLCLNTRSEASSFDPFAVLYHFKTWVDIVGMGRLRHIRDLEVVVDGCYKPSCGCSDEYIRLQFIEGSGLHVTYVNVESEQRQLELDWRFAVADLRARESGCKGEAIIDYFMSTPDVWAGERFEEGENEDDYVMLSTGIENPERYDRYNPDIQDRYQDLHDNWYGANSVDEFKDECENEEQEEIIWSRMRSLMDERSYARYVKREGYWVAMRPVTE